MRVFALCFVFSICFSASWGQSVVLDWDANSEPDLSHYNLYRSNSFEGPYEMLGLTTRTIVTGWTAEAGATTATATHERGVAYTANGGGFLRASIFYDSGVRYGQVYLR